MGTRGIQDPVALNLIDELLAENQKLWTEITNLKATKRNEAGFLIKLYDDESAAEANKSFIFSVPLSCDGLYLETFDAFVTSFNFDTFEIDLYNWTWDYYMLTDYLTISSGNREGDPTYIIDNKYRQVFWKDQLSIDLVTVGDATGLGIILEFQ